MKNDFEKQKEQKKDIVTTTEYKVKQKKLNGIEDFTNKFSSDQKPKKYYNSKQYKLKSIKNPII